MIQIASVHVNENLELFVRVLKDLNTEQLETIAKSVLSTCAANGASLDNILTDLPECTRVGTVATKQPPTTLPKEGLN